MRIVGHRFFPIVVLALLGTAAYWNSLHAPFVFDDLDSIQRNGSVRFQDYFKYNPRLYLQPRSLLFLTFAFNQWLSGQNVFSYHAVNLFLHVVNALLVFWIASGILRKITSAPSDSRMYALLAAAFFLCHPVQTESVTYISSRSELLSTLFYLIGFLVFVLWPEGQVGFLCSLAVGIPYLFGLGSKETAVTLPASIFVYDYLLLSGAEFRLMLSRWRFYLTYVLGASAAIHYLLAIGLKGVVGGNAPGTLSSQEYLLTQTRVLIRYIQLILFPVGLNLDYDFRPSLKLFEPGVLISIILLTTLFFLSWRLRHSRPLFAFSILWFFITLMPTSSVVPIIDVIFEHRLYLPMAGVALSFPLLIEFLYENFPQPFGGSAKSQGTWAYSSLILTALLVGTVIRNQIWADEVRLFSDVVSKSPYKQRAYNSLALAHYRRGEYDQAVAVLEQAFEKIPDKVSDLWDTLGNMYLKSGQYDKGIALFDRRSRLITNDREQMATSYNNLGVAYLYLWNDLQNRRNQITADEFNSQKEQILKPAADAFSKALEVDRTRWSSFDSYINVLCYRDKGSELETVALDRLKQGDNFYDLYTVGKVSFNSGDFAKADTYFERAEAIRSDVRILFFNHGYALTMMQQTDRAIDKYLRTTRIDPIFNEAHYNLALLYLQKADYSSAVEHLTDIVNREPANVRSRMKLAEVYAFQRNLPLARQQLQQILQANPQEAQALSLLEKIGR